MEYILIFKVIVIQEIKITIKISFSFNNILYICIIFIFFWYSIKQKCKNIILEHERIILKKNIIHVNGIVFLSSLYLVYYDTTLKIRCYTIKILLIIL